MADGSVRGSFELSAEQPIRQLHAIRDAGTEGDAALDALGRRMDEISRKRITPKVELKGFDVVNAQLTELERRLDRFDRRRATAHVGMGGGLGGGGGGQGMVAGGPGSPLFSSLGGMAGRLPWWAMAAPVVPQLLGGAGALIGSAGSATLGAGTIGLGGMGALGAGGLSTALLAKGAITDLQNVTKAQTAYNSALEVFGRRSTQAATAKRNLDLAMANAPAGAAGAARQIGLLRGEFQTATRPGTRALYGSIAQGAYSLRGALPTVAPLINRSASVTGAAGADYVSFLTGTQSLNSYRSLVSGFAQDLPIAERSVQSLTRLFLNLSVDALPFFHEANVWVNNWTRNMANQSQDQQRVQSRMREMVTSARDWERLLAAAGRDMKDLLGPSVAPGNSMVVTFTNTLDRWDVWLRDNPQKVRQFFDDGVRGTERIATVIGNLTSDVWQIFRAVEPILSRAEQFMRFASGLGGGSLLTGAGLLYGGYEGARRALGGGGPSAGGVASSFIFGGIPRGGGPRAGGGAVIGASAAEARALGSRTFLVPRPGFQTAARAAAVGEQGQLFAALGGGYVMSRAGAAEVGALATPEAFAARYGGVAGARFAAPELLGAREAGLLARGGSALAGAARGAAPIMLGLAAIQGLTTALGTGGGVPHAIGAGLSTAGSTLTLGAVSPAQIHSVLHAAFGTDNAGASLAGQQGFMRSISAQASSVRTPAQLRALQARVAPRNLPVRFEMSPGDQRTFSAFLQHAATVAAQNAGASASNTWENAFQRGLTTMGPGRAVTTMLGGMQTQLRQLGPAGSRAFASDTAQWAASMVQSDPRLQRPMSRLMQGIMDDVNHMSGAVGKSFSDMHKMVFYFNGQILQGSASTWKAIGTALTDPAQVAQEKLSGIFGAIQRESMSALTSMGFSGAQARQIVTGVSKGSLSSATVGQGVSALGGLTASGLSRSQAANVVASAINTGQRPHARGGIVGGRGLLDTVTLPDGSLAAPGEAWIANRHTMMDLSRASVAMYGKTAWQMIHDEGRPHSAPARRRAALGMVGYGAGQQGSGSVVIDPGVNMSVGQEPMILNDLRRLSQDLRQVVYVISGYRSPSHSVAVGGFANDPHTRGEAADIGIGSASRASMFSVPESALRAVGLYRPFYPQSAAEVNHVQLLQGAAARAQIAGAVAGAVTPTAARQLRLRAPSSGLAGIPGALADAASAAYTSGMQMHVNGLLGSATGGGRSAAGFTGGGSAAANQRLGQRMMLSWGWPMSEWPSLQALWTQESGWDANSVNKSSGAYGIPQALGHGHPFNLGDAPGQIAWGLDYIRNRYGSPSAAEAHERAHNWYARGGRLNWAGWNAKGGEFVTHGPTLVGVGEKGRERVSITPVGKGGRQVNVHFHGPVYARDAKEVEALGEMVASKILAALGEPEGASDAELAGAV